MRDRGTEIACESLREMDLGVRETKQQRLRERKVESVCASVRYRGRGEKIV